MHTQQQGRGEVALKVLMTPNDLNHHGTVFGGAMLSYFDIAASGYAMEQVGSQVVLASQKDSAFLLPVFANEYVVFYARTQKTGRTSITVTVEAWRSRPWEGTDEDLVATATLVMVAVNADLRPQPIRPRPEKTPLEGAQ